MAKWFRKKKESWDKICKMFNAHHSVNNRSLKQLKDLWKNLKMKAKQSKAQEKRERKKTGGGPPVIDQDPISDKVSAILPSEEMESFSKIGNKESSLEGHFNV